MYPCGCPLQIFHDVLKGKCEDKKSGARKLVVDVGANFGYFTTYAAKMGCRYVLNELGSR